MAKAYSLFCEVSCGMQKQNYTVVKMTWHKTFATQNRNFSLVFKNGFKAVIKFIRNSVGGCANLKMHFNYRAHTVYVSNIRDVIIFFKYIIICGIADA